MKFNFKKFFCLFLILALFDAGAKYFAFACLPKMSWIYPTYPYGGMGLFKDFFGVGFSLNHVENEGIAWGLFSSYGSLIFWLRVLVVLGLALFLFFVNKEKRLQLPLSLITIGAFGNILDTLIYGHVIDIFNFVLWDYSFPVFNLADAYITIGVALLLFMSLKKNKSGAKDES